LLVPEVAEISTAFSEDSLFPSYPPPAHKDRVKPREGQIRNTQHRKKKKEKKKPKKTGSCRQTDSSFNQHMTCRKTDPSCMKWHGTIRQAL